MKDINRFADFLQRFFKTIAINTDNLVLNGSFNSSYFASDIDLYESVDDPKLIQHKLKSLKDSEDYDFIELKVQYTNGKKRKYYSRFNNVKIGDGVSFVKLDMIVYYFCFPMECTIIWNTGTIQLDELVEAYVADIEKTANKNTLKAVKRINNIMDVIGLDENMESITENSRLGVIYLCINRMEVLDVLKNKLPKKEIHHFRQMIKDDLRKYNLKITDPLQSILNKEVTQLLRKL